MSTAATEPRAWRAWVPEASLAGAVLALGLGEARSVVGDQWPVLVGVSLAVLFSRRVPAAALAIVWVVGVMHAVLALPILVIEVAVTIVAFGCARWGSTLTVIASGLSIPAAATVAVFLVISENYGYGYLNQLGASRELVFVAETIGGGALLAGAATLGVLVLLVPWLAGLAVRAMARARTSTARQKAAEEDAARAVRDTEQAREIARLREDQARMARDVHDVVGHSLAVILAQAESAQYIPDSDAQKLKETMATIATSARSSLQDVRQVLTTTRQPENVRDGGLDGLVAGVRSSGHRVASVVVGQVQPLPPELEVVAYRVLQEMLTNAIKHGRRDTTMMVEQHWGSELRIEVRNVVRSVEVDPAPEPAPTGQGLAGMRHRLEAVGGRLDVQHGEGPDGPTFTSTAWVPMRAVA